MTLSTTVCNQVNLGPVPLMPAGVALGVLAPFMVGGAGFEPNRRRSAFDRV
ncbi:hypothetical protein [Frankia sp. Cppng1_Ct_nod]|uniref:hypothetical protein n=1 Tax=Frankia sp. Cppng1_Ct_nod TaxID=2897162 RepID=UPI0013EFA848|nr:hypothetical protein [Frankia sp. Cppng1_Ct_nod]